MSRTSADFHQTWLRMEMCVRQRYTARAVVAQQWAVVRIWLNISLQSLYCITAFHVSIVWWMSPSHDTPSSHSLFGFMTWNDLQLLRLRRRQPSKNESESCRRTFTKNENESTSLIVLQLKTSPCGQYPHQVALRPMWKEFVDTNTPPYCANFSCMEKQMKKKNSDKWKFWSLLECPFLQTKYFCELLVVYKI